MKWGWGIRQCHAQVWRWNLPKWPLGNVEADIGYVSLSKLIVGNGDWTASRSCASGSAVRGCLNRLQNWLCTTRTWERPLEVVIRRFENPRRKSFLSFFSPPPTPQTHGMRDPWRWDLPTYTAQNAGISTCIQLQPVSPPLQYTVTPIQWIIIIIRIIITPVPVAVPSKP